MQIAVQKYKDARKNKLKMLSVFGLSFLAVYIVLKWRYVVPTIYGSDHVVWSVWPYSLISGGIAFAQIVATFPKTSVWALYTQLFVSVLAVASPDTKAWKSCIVAILLSSMHIFRKGSLPQIIVTALLLAFLIQYYRNTRHLQGKKNK